jgi:hypothetical protein
VGSPGFGGPFFVVVVPMLLISEAKKILEIRLDFLFWMFYICSCAGKAPAPAD